MSSAFLSHPGGLIVNKIFLYYSLKLNRGVISPDTEMIVNKLNWTVKSKLTNIGLTYLYKT